MEVSHPPGWGGEGADGDLVTRRHEVDRENTLRLYAVTATDAGAYVCTAQSQLGTAAATARLRVEGQRGTSVASTATGTQGHLVGGGPCKGSHLTGAI